jgi:hypothetical protein
MLANVPLSAKLALEISSVFSTSSPYYDKEEIGRIH